MWKAKAILLTRTREQAFSTGSGREQGYLMLISTLRARDDPRC